MLPPDLVRRASPLPPPPPPPKPAARVEYHAKAQETPAGIGKKFGVSEQAMQKANPSLQNAQQPLRAGTTVTIPTGAGDGQARVATVEQGHTPADIARENGVSEADLRAANNLGAGEPVDPGTRLLLPADAKPAQADPTTIEGLKELFPSLEGRSKADLQKIVDNVGNLRDSDATGQFRAAAELARDLQGADTGKLVEALGLKDNPVAKLLTDTKALGALSTVADPGASAVDKAKAVLTLTESAGGVLPGKLGEALKPYLGALPSVSSLVSAIDTFTSADASPLDKAKASLDLVKALRTSVGTAFPQLAQELRGSNSLTNSVGAALTLLDPDASISDRAQAALDLGANVPSIAGDLGALGDFLRSNGVTNPDAVLAEINRLPVADRLPDSVKTSLDPAVARSLTGEQADQLARLAANPDLADGLSAALKQVKDPEAAGALLKSLGSVTDAGTQKAVLDTVSGLKPGVADKLLLSTIDGKPAAEMLASTLGKLDAEGQKNLAKLVKNFDEGGLRTLLKLSDSVDGALLKDTLKVLGEVDSARAGKVLEAFDKLLGKLGVEITGEIAGKLLKGLTKIIPVAGALPAAASVIELGGIAANKDLPADIRFLALQGAKLNGADAALSIVEPFIAEFGVPIIADLGLGGAELAIDLVVTSELAKYNADPSGYKAPELLQAANVALAAAQGPQGAIELALIYGPNGAVDLTGAVTRLGGEAAIKAADVSATLTAQGIGQGAHYTAEGLHQLADVIRNPEKYGAAAVALGKQAVDELSNLAQGAGELAKQAATELKNVADDLKDLGIDGVKALGWIASHPGAAAEVAIGALGDLSKQGLELAGDAGRALAKASMDALGTARDALSAAGDAARGALGAADRAITGAVDSAIALGKEGIETLGWIANNPGAAADIAKDALVDAASQAGEFAKEAYDQLVGLGADGVELIKDVAGNLKDAGEAGIEMLKYVVENPGAAASEAKRIALDGLKSLANEFNEAADAIAGFVNNGVEEAYDTAKDLLAAGGDAAEHIASVFANELTDGAKEVISGLEDLGDAGLDALNDLKNAGVGFAGKVLGGIGNGVKNVTGIVSPFW